MIRLAQRRLAATIPLALLCRLLLPAMLLLFLLLRLHLRPVMLRRRREVLL
jgi:hypothetical protein